MSTRSRWLCLVLVCGSTLAGTGCGTYLRDAIIGGAMDFVSGSTANLLSSLLPLPTNQTE